MINAFIWGSLGVFGGFALALWLIGREDPPVVQAITNPQHFISAENLSEFAEEWQYLEERVDLALSPEHAHHLLSLEKKSNKIFFTISSRDIDKQEELNRFGFAKWLVDSGKMSEFPVDGIA